jgi:hypothetical protein
MASTAIQAGIWNEFDALVASRPRGRGPNLVASYA